MKRRWVGLIVLLVITALETPLVLADGPYRGKVIDADTQQPIEGAVVVAVWIERIFRPFQDEIAFREAKEVFTNKDGTYEIPGYIDGEVGKEVIGIQRPHIYIFKAGYGSYPTYMKVPPGTDLLKFNVRQILAQLPALKTIKEKLDAIGSAMIFESVPNKQVPNWIKLVNEERIHLGLDPVNVNPKGYQ